MAEAEPTKTREWPDDFSMAELTVALACSVAGAVAAPLIVPRVFEGSAYSDWSWVGVLVALAFAIGFGAWSAVEILGRRFPLIHWQRTRSFIWLVLVVAAALAAASSGRWTLALLLGLVAAERIATRKATAVFHRLAWLERLAAYQATLSVTVNIRSLLQHPVVKEYFDRISSHDRDDEGAAYRHWLDARSAEWTARLGDAREADSVAWSINGLTADKDGTQERVRALYHEWTLGPERSALAPSSGVTIRVCMINGWLKLQVGPYLSGDSPESEQRGYPIGYRRWATIVDIPIYTWGFVHHLPAMWLGFDSQLEERPWARLDDATRNERQKRNRVATVYDRYQTENDGVGRYRGSYFAGAAERAWVEARQDWLKTSGAEDRTDDWPSMRILFPRLCEVRLIGGVNWRDKSVDKVLAEYVELQP